MEHGELAWGMEHGAGGIGMGHGAWSRGKRKLTIDDSRLTTHYSRLTPYASRSGFCYFAPRFLLMGDVNKRRPYSQLTQAQLYYPIIELIDKDFEIPQLGKKRRIWALLPHDYYDSDRTYPVLYLQDAQN